MDQRHVHWVEQHRPKGPLFPKMRRSPDQNTEYRHDHNGGNPRVSAVAAPKSPTPPAKVEETGSNGMWARLRAVSSTS